MNDFVKKVSQKVSKLSEEQLERFIEGMYTEKNVLNSIVESLATGLVIVDPQWNFLQANKAADRLLPFRKRHGETKNDAKIWDLLDEPQICAFLHSCAEKQQANVKEEFSLAQEDKVRFITLGITSFVQDSEIAGSIITVDDITEKRQQEILLHRMESLAGLTNLAASVAHEIKNPLGAISIHIQLLQKAVKKARNGDGLLPAEKFMENYLNVVTEEIDNLNKIVVDFLFAVRPVQANLILAEPDGLIEKFAAFFSAECHAKSVQVDLHLCKSAPRLFLDEKLFREVIINLVQNALSAILERFPVKDMPQADHSGQQGGQLLVESTVKDDKYLLTIADNGAGMDEKTVSKIFEPYYTTKVDGTGLGLTMVYKIIKEFRGDIDVKSVLGHGTAFTIWLPIPQAGMKLLEDKGSAKLLLGKRV